MTKNHAKQNTDSDGSEQVAGKEEKPAAGHGHAHGHDKPDKHAPAGKKDDAMAAKLADLEDRHLRLLADFDNYRKRSMREKEAAARLVRENMLIEFLPVIDNIELGINAALAHKADKAFIDGYRMVSDQLTAALARFGLKAQEAEGVQFDPNLHEAIQQVPSADHPAGTVLSVVRKGYLSGDAVLRPAQVLVSSGPAEKAGGAGESQESSGQDVDEAPGYQGDIGSDPKTDERENDE